MKTNLLLLICLFISVGIFAQTFNPDYLDGRIMFKLKDNVSIESADIINKLPFKKEAQFITNVDKYPQIKQLLSQYSVYKYERPSYYTKNTTLMRIFRVYFSNHSEIDNIIRDLKALDIIEFAEKEPIYKIDFTPNDIQYQTTSNKWYLTLVNAEQAWNISLGSNAIKVAIVDNAVFCGHSDLTTYAQRDVADADNDATPPTPYTTDLTWSHGTHCAGLATADINNGIGMPSLGGNVELIGVKCTPNSGTSGSVYYSYDGMQWACQNGANVVSMSYGGSGYSNSVQALINAYPAIVFLAAAGNDGSSTIQYPGGYDNVICVGSVDGTDLRSSFSNYNGTTNWVDIASPGGYTNSGLLSTVYSSGGNNYSKMGGTSMATPFAAGLAGLMLSLNSTLSPTDILNCMLSSGVNINQNIGPRINAYAALQCVQSSMTGNPTANFAANHTTVNAGNTVTFTDLSNNGGIAITTWQWTFTGGTPSSYTGQNPPAITYSTIGTYAVSLTVTNSQSSDIETKSAYINVVIPPYGSWIEQATGFSTVSRGINNISIVDANIVWATAYDGSGGGANIQAFTKTTNGGTSWTAYNTINLGNTALGVSMIHAFDANTAWLAAYPNASGQTGGIWKTTNGGTTWTRQATATYNNAASFTNVVYFWDANNGFCQGDPINSDFECYTTSNGGTTWTLVPAANLPVPLSGEYGYTRQIEVVGDNVWFTTNKGRIYKSTNRGLNFVVYQTPLTDFGGTTQSANFSFKDANNGLIIDNNSAVYRTTDGGANWTTVTVTGSVETAGLCWVEGTDIVFSAGATGSTYSPDGGNTWSPIDTEQHTTVEFKNSSTGWSGWFNDSPTTKGIWKWQNTSNLIVDFSGVPTSVCTGSTVAFTDQTTGGTPTSWNWSFPGGTPATSTSQNPTITYNSPGTYNVILTVNDGNAPATDTIYNYVTVMSAPTQPSAITGDLAPCAGSIIDYSVILDFGANYTWTLPADWTGSSTLNIISATVGSQSGTITVTPSNSCGTGTAQTINVSPVQTPVASYTYVANLGVVDFTNTSTPNGTTFNWDFGDGNTSNLENPTHTYTAVGTYTVILTVTNSCGPNLNTQVINILNVSIDELSNSSVQIFPNPTSNFINITSEFSSEASFELLDVTGKVILNGIFSINEKTNKINVENLESGIYSLKLMMNDQTLTKQIIIKK